MTSVSQRIAEALVVSEVAHSRCIADCEISGDTERIAALSGVN